MSTVKLQKFKTEKLRLFHS